MNVPLPGSRFTSVTDSSLFSTNGQHRNCQRPSNAVSEKYGDAISRKYWRTLLFQSNGAATVNSSATFRTSFIDASVSTRSRMANLDIFDRTWKTLRQSGALHSLLNSELAPVPDISTASSLGLFSVFIKSKENVLAVLKPVYHVIGHVGQIAQLEKVDIKRLLESYGAHSETIPWLPHKKWEADIQMGNEMVHLTLHDVSKLVLPLNLSEGDVYLNMNIPELASTKTVYIVTDVLKVSGMTIAVSGDDDRMTFQNLSSHMPVGFAYKKFRLRADGCVCEAMDSGIRTEAKWRVLTSQLTPYLNILPSLDD